MGGQEVGTGSLGKANCGPGPTAGDPPDSFYLKEGKDRGGQGWTPGQ